MAKTHTSTADEGERTATAPSDESAKKTPPETTEASEDRLYLIEELEQLPDYDLVKIGLAIMAVLYRRAEAFSKTTADAEETSGESE